MAGGYLQLPEVLVRGSNWSQAMLDNLEAAGAGTGGLRVSTGAAQFESVPYVSVDELLIRFDEDVTVPADALSVTGINVADYQPGAVMYDPATFTARWPLGVMPNVDRLQVHLGESVQDVVGNALDGEWQNGVSTMSGDGAAGGDLEFALNVVAADQDRNGTVGTGDLQIVLSNFTRSVPVGRFSEGDYAGPGGVPDGVVGTADLAGVLARFTQTLPTVARSTGTTLAAASATGGHARQRAALEAFIAEASRMRLRLGIDAADVTDDDASTLDSWVRGATHLLDRLI